MRGGKERILRTEEDCGTLNIYTYKDSIMKPTKHCLKKGGGRNVRICPGHTVHMYGIITMKPLILLMYTNSKIQ
jgi:hypothetical protein